MDLIRKHLVTLDLTEEEILIYINALETGSSTVLEYAQNTGIPRTTVYLLVDSLIQKGLILEQIDGKKKRYLPATPQELIALAQKKQEQFKQTAKALETDLNQLQALYNLKQGKPKVTYFEGKNELKKVFEAALGSEKIYMYFMSEADLESQILLKEEFFEAVLKNMIPTQQILIENSANVEFRNKFNTTRNQIICLDKQFATKADYFIYNDSIVYITYKDGKPAALVIEDLEISFLEKSRFQLVWKMAEHLSMEK